ncbi:MAG: nucleotidyltransferase domain-containing protein [Candidatus Hydrogenedentes bacterium]|nr:nucleotidyltransferase domain-containing protein [Candidatus Hydrogenedentota bacterium]
MDNPVTEKVFPVFERFPGLKLVYFFGSRAAGDPGPMSDYDFAVYFDGLSNREIMDSQLSLLSELQKALATDAVDLVVLNTAEAPELKYEIIKNGLLIYDVEPYRVLVEPQILNEYFDFYDGLKRFGLTRAAP